jgi:hypothetical protein
LPNLEGLETQFLDALATLQDALENIVIVGGWCPYLYAKHLWKKSLPNIPTTLDIDLGVLETGSQAYPQTVYDKLKQEGFAMERIYADEAEPVEFVSQRGKVELKLEFITSFYTSDDTLNRFLGRGLACNRLDAFEILLEHARVIEIEHQGRRLRVRTPDPAAFMFHKGISFVARSGEYKQAKDLFYLYFIFKYHPQPAELMQKLTQFQGHEFFANFAGNVREYLADYSCPGYGMIGKFLGVSLDPRSVYADIKRDLAGLLEMVQNT